MTQNIQTKERLVWVDALRGGLIALVVLGHALQHGDFENARLWCFINSFHVPTFFVISGWLNYKPQLAAGTLRRRAREMLLPFLTWSLLLVAAGGFSQFGSRFVGIMLHPDSGFWFLYCLFAVILLFFLLDRLAKWLRLRQETLTGGVFCY